jgi:hypothetical protein
MNNDDTVKLLRECDSGVKMGISAIDEVFNSVSDRELCDILMDSKKDHESLDGDIAKLLDEYDADSKEPNIMAQTMSWMKTNVKLAVNESDRTVANLMTEGCDMGIRSLYRYLNEYTTAEKRVRDIALKLISVEEHMRVRMRKYL